MQDTIDTGLQNNISTLQGNITTLDGKVSTAQTDITSLNNALAAESTRAQAAEAANAANFDNYRTATAQDGVDNAIWANIGTVEGDIENLKDVLNGLDSRIVSNANAITTEKTRAEGVENNLNTQIDGLNSTLGTVIEPDIAALKTSKQDKLTAGSNVSITNNTISVDLSGASGLDLTAGTGVELVSDDRSVEINVKLYTHTTTVEFAPTVTVMFTTWSMKEHYTDINDLVQNLPLTGMCFISQGQPAVSGMLPYTKQEGDFGIRVEGYVPAHDGSQFISQPTLD